MIKLTLFSGHPIWVNPDRVASVQDVIKNDSRTGNARLIMTSSEVIEVKCYAEVVVNMLEG